MNSWNRFSRRSKAAVVVTYWKVCKRGHGGSGGKLSEFLKQWSSKTSREDDRWAHNGIAMLNSPIFRSSRCLTHVVGSSERARPGRVTLANLSLRSSGALRTITRWFDESRIFVNIMIWRRDIIGIAFNVVETAEVTPKSLIACMLTR